jgi:hypothetical protein
MTDEPHRLDRDQLAAATQRLNALGEAAATMGALARQLTAGLDRFVIADHPDLDDLNNELDNLYPTAFDDPPA